MEYIMSRLWSLKKFKKFKQTIHPKNGAAIPLFEYLFHSLLAFTLHSPYSQGIGVLHAPIYAWLAAGFSGFSPLSKKHAGTWTSYTKLAIGVNGY